MENIVNIRDNSDENTAASHKQSTSKRTRNDAISDDMTHNAARLLGKMSQGKVNKQDMTVARETTESNKRSCNNLMTTQKHMTNEENRDKDDEDEEDKSKDEDEVNNNDNLLNSGFSNGSYDDQQNCVNYDKQNNNEQPDDTNFLEKTHLLRSLHIKMNYKYIDELIPLCWMCN